MGEIDKDVSRSSVQAFQLVDAQDQHGPGNAWSVCCTFIMLGSFSAFANAVVRISEAVVVKFGTLFYEEEAQNLKRAHALIDQKLLRVPQVPQFVLV